MSYRKLCFMSCLLCFCLRPAFADEPYRHVTFESEPSHAEVLLDPSEQVLGFTGASIALPKNLFFGPGGQPVERAFVLHLAGHKRSPRIRLVWDQLHDNGFIRTEDNQPYSLPAESFWYAVIDHLRLTIAAALVLGLIVIRLFFFEKRDKSQLATIRALEKLGDVRLDQGKTMFDRLGSYYILRRLGEGAFGGVYLACDVNRIDSTGLVTIKRLLTESKTEEQRGQLQREAARAKSVEHPNVVRILDYDTENSEPYIVMEYIRGQSLEHYLKENGHPQMSPQEALKLLSPLQKGSKRFTTATLAIAT